MTERDNRRRDAIVEAKSSPDWRPSPVPRDPSEADAPAELAAIRVDDTLLDALGGADPQTSGEFGGVDDEELGALLLAWRRDVDSEPLAELMDTDSAVTTVKTAALAKRHSGHGRRRRMLVPVAAAAAVLAIAFTGTALAARDAQPGDTLWGLSKVLYSDHAQSVEAAASVRTELQQAGLALAQQRYDDARKALAAAEQALANVNAEDELEQLKARHMALMAQLDPQGQQQNQPTRAPQQPNPGGSDQSRPGGDSSVTGPPESSSSSEPPEESTSTPTSTPTPSDTPTSETPTPTTEETSNSESQGLGNGEPAPLSGE